MGEERLATLQQENSLGSALAFFKTVISIKRNARLSLEVYRSSPAGCAYYGNASRAARTCARLERQQANIDVLQVPNPSVPNAGEIGGAEPAFTECHEI